ncbi:uncharacterized protein G2W53_032863 [Senna tora]|uniref:Uncharacterized protein n=1 Tax=Senna tora TaxID=362788 RepID=A0A834SZ12_9FABA|nr:uncharacterized protein G2W53_032863 [Senna tora]
MGMALDGGERLKPVTGPGQASGGEKRRWPVREVGARAWPWGLMCSSWWLKNDYGVCPFKPSSPVVLKSLPIG